MSLHQKQVWLLGDVYTLAVNNTLTLPGSQTNPFFTKKKWKVSWRVRFTCSSWTSSRDIGFSAVEDVDSRPETITKHSHPNANVNLTTSPMHMGKVADKTTAESHDLCVRYVSPYSTKLFSPAQMCKTLLSMYTKVHAHQGKLIWVTASK